MSATVEASHQSHFLSILDSMARPGSGWDHDPYAPRHGYRDHQEHLQGPSNGRLPGPSSLFSSSPGNSVSPSTAPAPPSAFQYPTSSPRRDAQYNSGRPAYHGDRTTPSPLSQTPQILSQPAAEHSYYSVAPRRPSDVRLSPTLSSTTSDRSDEFTEAAGGYGNMRHSISSEKAPMAAPNLSYHMHQPIRQPPHHEDTRHAVAGGLMGKLVPQSYSANGRPPRPVPPPPPPLITQPASQPSQPSRPMPQQPLQHVPETTEHPTPHSAQPISQQQQQRQKYPASPQYHHQPPPPPPPPQQQQTNMAARPDARQMSIHNLLSTGGGGGESGTAGARLDAVSGETAGMTSPSTSKAPMTVANGKMKQPSPTVATPSLGPWAGLAHEYKIRVRQQPVAARSCGFGERDRRVIDPPPIVQLTIEDPNATAEELASWIHNPYLVVHCSIFNEAGNEDSSAMPEDYRQQRRLMGTLVSSPFTGLDENGDYGCFFTFPDLSCRTPGSFRLKFSIVVPSPSQMKRGAKCPILATAMSEVFTVYNAKDFPGMQASTPLTKRLKEQGCLISIKKGNERVGGTGGGASSSRDRDDSEDDDEDAGGGGSAAAATRRKRPRKV